MKAKERARQSNFRAQVTAGDQPQRVQAQVQGPSVQVAEGRNQTQRSQRFSHQSKCQSAH